MNEIIICEKCGEQMICINQERTAGMACPKCGWGWVTSHFDKIDTDRTDYSIFLKPGNPTVIVNIKLIASLCSVNFIEAKNILQANVDTCIYTATNESSADYSKAGKVKHIASILKAAKLDFYIMPDFPYKLED
ncbi:MAG: hypothetical protein HUJ76_04425 [Parasporobacterium sp.]|nr:hypothetical protein [Parasporobacterium sp.]